MVYNYPGVYVEELPSSVRTIMGVGTSITAFVGRALKGPVDKATMIHSFADYQRIFGGLWKKSNMSYAVYQYYQNGGTDAIIVRVVQTNNTTPKKAAEAAKFKLDCSWKNAAGGVVGSTVIFLVAANPGLWGENLDVKCEKADVDKIFEDCDPTYYDFTVCQKSAGPSERWPILEQFRNVSLNPEKPRFIGDLLTDGVSTYLQTDRSAAKNQVTSLNDFLNANIETEKTALATAESALAADPNNSNLLVAVVTARNNVNDAIVKAPFELTCTSVLDEASDGSDLDSSVILGKEETKTGIYALKDVDLFNLLCIPAYASTDTRHKDVYNEAMTFCNKRRAILLVDPPADKRWNSPIDDSTVIGDVDRDKNGAVFFPRIITPDPLEEYRLNEFDPCGAVAGVIARTDAQRGVWKAPAGIDATLSGVSDFSVKLTNDDIGGLNPKGVNCLRVLPDVGRVVWGSRTLRGADSLADQWKYLPVRRTALFIEESLFRGTQWVVFEPNDERLWSQIRLNVGAFMHSLFVKGAFQGADPKGAYLVKCDSETTTQNDINSGIVNIIVGFAPLKPAEFVVLKIQQLAGQEE